MITQQSGFGTWYKSNFALEIILTLFTGAVAGLLVYAISSFDLSNKLIAVLVGAVGILVVVLLVRDLQRLMLAAVMFDLGVGLDVHVTCTRDYFISECGVSLSVTTLALVILYGLWIVNIRRDHESGFTLRPRLGPIGTIGAAFILLSLPSLVAAHRIDFSLYMVWIYIQLLALYFYLCNHINSEKELLLIVALIVGGVLVQNVIMRLEVFKLINEDTLLRFQNRIVGTFKSPNTAGAFLSQMSLILLSLFALRLRRYQKWVLGGTILLTLVNLIGTESRGGWTAFVIGLLIIIVVSLAKRWLDLRRFVLILLAGAVIAVLFSEPIIQRLTGNDNGAADARAPLVQIALNMIRANPIVGVGWNNFGLALYDYISPDQFGAWLNLVHNAWLLIWSETGTFSFGLYVMFWLMILWYCLKLIRRGYFTYAVIALGIFASMIGASTHMMVEIFASRILAQIIWTNAALITAMTRLQQQRDLTTA